MPEMNGHGPGSFCWIELGTTDTDSAQGFYGDLFGWGTDRVDAGELGSYTRFQKEGRAIGGLYGLNPQQRAAGVPPHWLCHVAVEDVEASAARVEELGGTVLLGAMDVMDLGRIAVVLDPSGAGLALWQAESHRGMGVVGEPGTPCWFEFMSKDTGKSLEFYGHLFGWTSQERPMDGFSYHVLMNGEDAVGGMMQMGPEFPPHVPPHWMAYFSVEHCADSASRVTSLGGTICVPPMLIPHVGTFAVCSDAQGGTFSVIQLNPSE